MTEKQLFSSMFSQELADDAVREMRELHEGGNYERDDDERLAARSPSPSTVAEQIVALHRMTLDAVLRLEESRMDHEFRREEREDRRARVEMELTDRARRAHRSNGDNDRCGDCGRRVRWQPGPGGAEGYCTRCNKVVIHPMAHDGMLGGIFGASIHDAVAGPGRGCAVCGSPIYPSHASLFGAASSFLCSRCASKRWQPTGHAPMPDEQPVPPPSRVSDEAIAEAMTPPYAKATADAGIFSLGTVDPVSTRAVPGDGRCFACDKMCPGADYCYGCEKYVCNGCDKAPASALAAHHAPDDHRRSAADDV